MKPAARARQRAPAGSATAGTGLTAGRRVDATRRVGVGCDLDLHPWQRQSDKARPPLALRSTIKKV